MLKKAIMHGNAEKITEEIIAAVNGIRSFRLSGDKIVKEFQYDNEASSRFMQLAAAWIETCAEQYRTKNYDKSNELACMFCARFARSEFVEFYAGRFRTDFSTTAAEVVSDKHVSGLSSDLQQVWTTLCFRILDGIKKKDVLLDKMIQTFTNDPRWYALPAV